MPQYWTDELTDRIAKDAESWQCQPANLLTWGILCGAPLVAALIVALWLKVMG